MIERLISIGIGYLFGLFQTGYIYGKLHHIDIRKYGSGNAGRTLGWRAGVITFLGDCLKCVAAALVVHLIYGNTHADLIALLSTYAGLGAVLGHNYPFYLKFKGGKGIAATAGLLLVTNVWLAVIAFAVFIIVVGITRYVSLGSLVLVAVFLIETIIYGQTGRFGLEAPAVYEIYGIVAVLMVLAFYKHRENIKRLIAGNENKLSFKK